MIILVVILFLACAADAAITADVVADWNQAAVGSHTISAFTSATAGSFNSWNGSPSSTLTRFSITNALPSQTYLNPITVSSHTYTTTGTNWLQNNVNAGTGDEYATIQFAGGAGGTITNVSIATFVQINVTNGTGSGVNLDQFIFLTSFGAYGVMQLQMPFPTGGTPYTLVAHSQGAGGDFGTPVNISQGKIYWVTLQHQDTNQFTRLVIWDPTTIPYTKIGESTHVNNQGINNVFEMEFASGYIGDLPSTIYSSQPFWFYNATSAQIDFMATNVSCASPIASTNQIPWGTDCGVPGGIPYRTTVYTNFYSTNTPAQITTGIANCPSNQVVFLNSGTYNITNATINLHSAKGVTVRGAGMQQTILKSWSMAGADPLTTDAFTPGGYVNLSSGYTQGSSNLVVSSTTGFSPGFLCHISQTDDPNLVYSDNSSTSNLAWMAVITATNATTITIWPPMLYTLSASLNPTIGILNGKGPIMSGIESLTIQAGDASGNENVSWFSSYQCWMTNVESVNCANYHILWKRGVQNEIRHCYTHGTSGTSGQGVYLYQFCSFCKVEDCEADNIFTGIQTDEACGNAILFNFETNCYQGGFAEQVGAFNADHLAHPMMNLWEGNVGNQWQADGYHGSSSHLTVFRNYFHGLHPTYSGNRKMVDVDRACYYMQIVGNVLGSASWTNSSTTQFMSGQPNYTANPCTYRFGYPNMGNNSLTSGSPTLNNGYSASYPDAQCLATATIAYNFDFATSTNVTACAGVPNSLFYSSPPPEWTGTPCPWPAFDPTIPLSASQVNIPAGLNYPYAVASSSQSSLTLSGTMTINGTVTIGTGQ